MSAFTVTVHAEYGQITWRAIGKTSADVESMFTDIYGVCGITVKPKRKA